MSFFNRMLGKNKAGSDTSSSVVDGSGLEPVMLDDSGGIGVVHRAEDEFRAIGQDLIPFGYESVLAYSRGSSPQLLARHSAELLARCRDFSPLAEHAASIGDELGLGAAQQQDILGELQACANQGLLCSRSDISGSWPKGEVGVVRVENVGVVTGDRPDYARRALDSLTHNMKAYGRTAELALYDNTSDEPTRAGYRRHLDELKRDGLAIRYAGMNEKHAYAQALAGTGLPAVVMEFCLLGQPGCGITYGANHNACHLDTIGTVGLELDDDTICRTGSMPGIQVGLELCARDPTEFWYYPDPDTACAALEVEERDFLSIHEELLGRPLRECRGTIGVAGQDSAVLKAGPCQ
ncbi:MAG: hypothetical protein ABIJ86_13955 [Spirochaetota bacterium]